MTTPFIRELLEPPDFSAPPSRCPRCGANNLWELNILSDPPIRMCLECCKERVRTRIVIEIKRFAKATSLEQLDADEMGMRLVYMRQKLRAIERLTMNYQKMRRITL